VIQVGSPPNLCSAFKDGRAKVLVRGEDCKIGRGFERPKKKSSLAWRLIRLCTLLGEGCSKEAHMKQVTQAQNSGGRLAAMGSQEERMNDWLGFHSFSMWTTNILVQMSLTRSFTKVNLTSWVGQGQKFSSGPIRAWSLGGGARMERKLWQAMEFSGQLINLVLELLILLECLLSDEVTNEFCVLCGFFEIHDNLSCSSFSNPTINKFLDSKLAMVVVFHFETLIPEMDKHGLKVLEGGHMWLAFSNVAVEEGLRCMDFSRIICMADLKDGKK
jgi:hypothetical protein